MTIKQGDEVKCDWDWTILEKMFKDGQSGKLTFELNPVWKDSCKDLGEGISRQ